MGKIKVCIVIPVYKNFSELSYYEKIALEQCFRVFGDRQFVFIGPKHLHWQRYLELGKSAKHLVFNGDSFSSIDGYSKLLISPRFYRSFKQFDYILIYQTDAFVFRDELEMWCNKGYDYVGAPWFDKWEHAMADSPVKGVGNGGFSLRKVKSQLKALKSFSYIRSPREIYAERFSHSQSIGKKLKNIAGLLLDLTVRNNTFWAFNNYADQEDKFWGIHVAANFSWYRLAPFEDAMAFSFETQQRRLYELNGHRLPFGCHAWWKYDLDFWKPHIRQAGYDV